MEATMKKLKKSLLGALTLLPLFAANSLNAATPVTTMSNAKDVRTDYILSASMEGGTQNCGPINRVVNGWVIDTEAYFNHHGIKQSTVIASQAGMHFANGTFTAPVDGYYQINVSVRVERQNGDLTLRKDGTAIAGLGTDLVERMENSVGQSGGPIGAYWSSHSVTKNLYLTTGETVWLQHESGQSNDCIFATSFKYNQFNVYLIRATGGNG